MCFKIKTNSIHAIAKEDITVYKVGEEIDGQFIPIVYHDFRYNLDELTPKLVFDYCNNIIERGYHSCDLRTAAYAMSEMNTMKRGRAYVNVLSNNGKERQFYNVSIARFTIPKGAEYFYGQANNSKTVKYMVYVSNQIIYKGLI